jgi:hypothetical protein
MRAVANRIIPKLRYARRPVFLPNIPQNCWSKGAPLNKKVEKRQNTNKPTLAFSPRLTSVINFRLLRIKNNMRNEIVEITVNFTTEIGSLFPQGFIESEARGPTIKSAWLSLNRKTSETISSV